MNGVNFNSFNNISYSGNKKQQAETKAQAPKNLGFIIAGSTIGVGLTALGIGRGLSKAGRGNVNKLYTFFTKKSNELAKKPVFTKTEKFNQEAVKFGKSVAESTRSVMNTISFKDILFKKFTNPIPGVGKVCQGITNFFEHVAVKTTENSYASTSKQFGKMFDAFEQASKKLSPETAKTTNNAVNNIKKAFDKNFSVDEVVKRIGKTKNEFANLDEEIWKISFKDMKKMATNKDTYSSFIAEKMMSGKKAKLASEVMRGKADIKFSLKDDYMNLKKLSEDIKGMVNPFDKKTMSILEDIKTNLEVFGKKNSPLAKQAIMEDMKNLTTFFEDKKVAEQFVKSIDNLPKTRTGNIQTLLEIYKKSLSKEEYKQLEKQVNKALQSLEKSTTLETENLFDKMRDLKIGSAPTDMLTLLATFATVGVGLGKAENDDERKSAALKFGIPAIGTVLTTMYGTLKMFTAAKSLAFGAVTGLFINKIGEAADNLRLQRKGQKDLTKEPIVEMPTVNEVTDAVIDNTKILSDAKRIATGTEFVINTVNEVSNNIKKQTESKQQA